MSKEIIILIILIVLLCGILLLIRGDEDAWICVDGEWIEHGSPSQPKPETGCGEEEVKSFSDCVKAGYPVLESYPRQCRTKTGDSFTEDIGNELEKADLIRVNYPRPNQEIVSPLLIEGEARGYWFFEASFPIEFFDDKDEIITSGIAQAQSDWMTDDFVPFKAALEFYPTESINGRLILKKDNPSGLAENDDQLEIPVIFQKAETVKIKIYFNNNEMDPEFSCNKVFAAEREVYKTETVGRKSLEELLKGPNEKEKPEGFLTSINENVKIQKLVIENGIATVDFNEQLEYQMGGSCRTAAIRAQITETLKQFPTVEEVIISINGRTEDILQP